LRTVITGGIRSFRDIHTIEKHRAGLAQVIEATASLFQRRALDQLVEATLTQLSSILMPHASALFFQSAARAEEPHPGDLVVAAATGRFKADVGRPVLDVLGAEVWQDVERSLATGELVVTPARGVYAFRRG